MSQPVANPTNIVPRGALIGAGVLIGLTIVAAAAGRMSGVGTVQTPVAEAVLSRDLLFEDRADGAVVVQEEPAGEVVAVLAPGTNGFIRGTLRGLARERRLNQISQEPPFRLAQHADDRLSLLDPATGRRIDLEAFGPTNREAFARLLTAEAPLEAKVP